jgi:hypothetical protein
LTFSVVSFAEIGIKASVAKLTVSKELYRHVLGGVVRVSDSHPTTDSPSPRFRHITAILSTGC